MNSVQPRKSSGQPWPLIGQSRLGASLLTMIDQDRWPATVLFSGPEHLGKKTAARWLAQRDLCRSARRPCQSCESCQAMNAGRHPECIVLFPEAGASVTRADLEHQLHQLIWRQSEHGGTRRWVLFGDIDRLSEQLGNTLLKIIEEPPARTNILMTTSRPDAVLPTIRSRAVTYRWQIVGANELDDAIRRTQPTLSVSQRRVVIAHADGRPGLARHLSAMPDRLEEEWHEAQSLMTAIETGRLGDREDVTPSVLDHCEQIVRDALLASRTGRSRRWPEHSDAVQLFAGKFQPGALLAIANRIVRRQTYLQQHVQPSLFFHDLTL